MYFECKHSNIFDRESFTNGPKGLKIVAGVQCF